MSEALREVYRQQRTAQDAYAYFLLAAAGAGIGFAVHRTEGMPLSWWMLPLGAAVVAWALSFACGCYHLRYIGSSLYANMALLQIEQGIHPDVPPHPDYMETAAAGVKDAIKSNSNWAVRFANWQFRFLIMGAVLFIGWHVISMAAITKPSPSSAEQRQAQQLGPRNPSSAVPPEESRSSPTTAT